MTVRDLLIDFASKFSYEGEYMHKYVVEASVDNYLKSTDKSYEDLMEALIEWNSKYK